MALLLAPLLWRQHARRVAAVLVHVIVANPRGNASATCLVVRGATGYLSGRLLCMARGFWVIRRAAFAAVAVVVLVGCGTGSGGGERLASPSRGSPSATPSPASSGVGPVAVAVPTCSSPEVKPSWWTPYCGDAGFQLDLSWDEWARLRARAHGMARVTHGSLAGQTWSIWVVFDRPVHVSGFKPRKLFSRATVYYVDRLGPDGRSAETIPLRDVWETAKWIAGEPDDCPTTTDSGIACGDTEDPSQLMASPSSSTR